MLEVPTVDFLISVCIDEEEKMKSWVGEIKRETGEGLMKFWRKRIMQKAFKMQRS